MEIEEGVREGEKQRKAVLAFSTTSLKVFWPSSVTGHKLEHFISGLHFTSLLTASWNLTKWQSGKRLWRHLHRTDGRILHLSPSYSLYLSLPVCVSVWTVGKVIYAWHKEPLHLAVIFKCNQGVACSQCTQCSQCSQHSLVSPIFSPGKRAANKMHLQVKC